MGRYSSDDSVRRTWDALHENYHCCGGTHEHPGFNVWRSVPGLNGSAPDSCCLTYREGCGRNVFNDANPNTLHNRYSHYCELNLELVID